MSRSVHPPRHAVSEAVGRALAEDLTPLGDLTSALLPDDLHAAAAFVARQPGVLAGRASATETFRQVDEGVELEWRLDDGDALEPGAVIAVARGPLPPILTAERTALNFLGHLSGIATRTRAFVDAAAAGGRHTRIWDTRKTTPGLRSLEKAAVRAGGGANHRGNLSDWILLKDNHIALFGIADAVARARATWPARTVHVECDRLDQVVEALAAGADALLLDNMTPDDVRACVAEAGTAARRPLLEVSGGVTLDTVAAYAATGVDCISVGGLTNAAPVLDIGLDIDPS
jgi:nicotinate-nucleotide pyrophosphorylase (carboxylating)